jgi:hypothetical protein
MAVVRTYHLRRDSTNEFSTCAEAKMRFLLHFAKWLSLIGLLFFVLAIVRLFISHDPFAAKLSTAMGTVFGYLLVPCALILTFVVSTRRLRSNSKDVFNTDPVTGLILTKVLTFISLVLLVALISAYFFRYETTAVASNGVAYRYDRWTGNTYFLLADKVRLMSVQTENQRCDIFDDLIPKNNK